MSENKDKKKRKNKGKERCFATKKQPIYQNQKMAAKMSIKHYNNATYDTIHFIKGLLIIPILLWKEVHFETIFLLETEE